MIGRLTRADETDLRRLLAADPATHLHPAAVLDERGIASGQAVFFGLRRDGVLCAAVALVGKARLAIPVGEKASDLVELGRELRGQFLGVWGPRELADALWEAGGAPDPWLIQSHRHLVITAEEMGPWTAPLRQATAQDLPEVLSNAAALHEEETGRDPLSRDPAGFRDRIAARIAAGRVWVLEEEGEIAFQVVMGAVGSQGAQLEGVYTVPVYRGLGLAAKGLGQHCRTQLARLPRLALAVNETNREALALARKLGFLPGGAFRLIRAD